MAYDLRNYDAEKFMRSRAAQSGRQPGAKTLRQPESVWAPHITSAPPLSYGGSIQGSSIAAEELYIEELPDDELPELSGEGLSGSGEGLSTEAVSRKAASRRYSSSESEDNEIYSPVHTNHLDLLKDLDSESILKGVLFSEILGKPRALRRKIR